MLSIAKLYCFSGSLHLLCFSGKESVQVGLRCESFYFSVGNVMKKVVSNAFSANLENLKTSALFSRVFINIFSLYFLINEEISESFVC